MASLSVPGIELMFLLVFLSSLSITWRWVRKYKVALPPGPKGLPFIGNLLHLPKEEDWLFWSKQKDAYGSICRISVFGQHIIALNDLPSISALAALRGMMKIVVGL